MTVRGRNRGSRRRRESLGHPVASRMPRINIVATNTVTLTLLLRRRRVFNDIFNKRLGRCVCNLDCDFRMHHDFGVLGRQNGCFCFFLGHVDGVAIRVASQGLWQRALGGSVIENSEVTGPGPGGGGGLAEEGISELQTVASLVRYTWYRGARVPTRDQHLTQLRARNAIGKQFSPNGNQ